MMLGYKKTRTVFGQISALYDQARTSYPEALIQDSITYSRLEKDGRILDVGCGSGQATLLFAQKGLHVLGIDIGKEMISVAKRKCTDYPNVEFQISSFEEIALPKTGFDTIISGMAWHWVTPEIRNEKAYKILKAGGTLALFWSNQQKEKSDLVMSVSKIIDTLGKPNRGPTGSSARQTGDRMYEELQQSKFFTDVERRVYYDKLTFSKQRYVDLVISYGWFQELPEERKGKLVHEFSQLLEKYEEPLVVPYEYILVLARKNSELE